MALPTMMPPVWAWWVLAALNVAAFGLAIIDKLRAQRALTRVRERTLLGVALLGGSIGLMAAMVLARHKVRKHTFVAKLLVVLAIQLAAIVLAAYTV